MGYYGGVGAVCFAIGAPGFGSQACGVAELVSPMQCGAVVFCSWGCGGVGCRSRGEL